MSVNEVLFHSVMAFHRSVTTVKTLETRINTLRFRIGV